MSVATPIISVRDVSKRFGGVQALSGVSFDVQPGEFHAICGENGAGKSTLMKILAGVIDEYEGEVRIAGEPVRFSGTRAAEAAGVSIIHQELNLVEQLSAAANIFLGREKRNAFLLRDDAAMRREAAKYLGELEADFSPDDPAGSLRVGDQQLVEIAKALSLHARILIMDEPTSALTESEVERLDRVIAQLRKKGVTILYISHKMEEIFRLSDRITVLRDGQFVRTLDRDKTDPVEIAHLMVGREIEQASHHSPRSPGETVVSVANLRLPWAGRPGRWRLQDVSFQVRAGEIVGFAGLMGAGRTELFECLFGANEMPFQGEYLLAGRPARFAHPRQAVKAGVALVTEDRKRLGLVRTMNVRENVTLSSLKEVATVGVVNPRRELGKTSETIQSLLIKTDGPEAPIDSLSGGNQQKCVIGRWLLTNPKALLLDDPTRGVDVGAKAELYRLMDRLCREGLAVLITSSELPELLAVCDRIYVLREGRITAHFTREEATEERIMVAAAVEAEAAAVIS
ncbi:MAG TPA: sugar ABC transporter ATP-binding protein [Pirellulaceae bacterium]|jgi:ABC-type sugar transport system ATPase subunit|nr:sugar ABC transporter ATP-binding protein [Pirellulaceae bacterium]